ncbi:MAG TPA: serine/threonine-protein kinase [Planctomycetota bacterium]|jgi:serine/threonine protein kinase
MSSGENDSVPLQIDAFNIEKLLWRGSRSTVYLARDTRDQALVALKVLYERPDCTLAEQHEYAAREADLLRRIEHPNIIRLRKHGEFNGVPFLSFPFIQGLALEKLAQRADMELAVKILILIKVARAVHHAHTKNVLHRDLKPHNILVDAAAEPYVLDWGLSWRKGDASTSGTNTVCGTPAYMSPEQARGEAKKLTSATDTYSLGAMLYELLTGKPPFEAESSWKVIQLAMAMPPRPPSKIAQVDPRFERVALTCLAKEPAKRYPSAAALADDLQRVLDNQEPKGPGTSLFGRLLRNS